MWVRIVAIVPHTESTRDRRDTGGRGWMGSAGEKLRLGLVIVLWSRTHQSVKGPMEVTGHWTPV